MKNKFKVKKLSNNKIDKKREMTLEIYTFFV